ncbi:4'-phosphopantetheinyl transferase family protein [Cypionkella sp. TWP1-2-1b2]|uniref:4'-phosphopantetheinyl transferase family protein n=1 Tax=Cypionkella sp. TWP1-2-1b2 TaxID=2804675 RepID=UPI003CFABF90
MSDITARLRTILPRGVTLAEATAPMALWPEEDLPGAVPARLAEFGAGRSAARQALRDLGLAPVAIPMALDRAPIWPEAATGSISHCAGACLAVMGLTRDYVGLGLDIEPLHPLPAELWSTVLRPEEHKQINDLPQPHQGLQALRIFVAKEATYKAQYLITRQIFDFQTLRIIWQDQSFTAELCTAISPIEKGFQIQGRCAENSHFFAAFCAVPSYAVPTYAVPT